MTLLLAVLAVSLGATALDAPAPNAPQEVALQQASTPRVELAGAPEGWTLADARITVAHEDTAARPGATRLARDHWVLELTLERLGAGGPGKALLEWNGAGVAIVQLPEDGRLAYDLGPRLERSGAYRVVLLDA